MIVPVRPLHCRARKFVEISAANNYFNQRNKYFV